jgi:alpha-amylase
MTTARPSFTHLPILRIASLAVMLAALGLGAHTSAPSALASPAGQAGVRTVAVNLFEWKWSDIQKECTSFLGPKGFAAVQVSPPNEHAAITDFAFGDGSSVSRPWWERYQPVSYQIVSRSGDLAAFKSMVAACNTAGVDVYVDAVINHMTGYNAGSGATWGSVGSTSYTEFSYAGVWLFGDFHADPANSPEHCARDIAPGDYGSNPLNAVRRCELVGLADLNTSSTWVRNKIADYLISLVNLPDSNGGVKGFRIDAAKHMNPEDIDDIVGRVRSATGKTPYIYLEVIDKGGEALQAAHYFGNPSTQPNLLEADIHEFKYEQKLAEKFLNTGGQKIAELISGTVKFGEGWGLMSSGRGVGFITNHDEQRTASQTVSYKNGALHELATVFMLAWPYGYPHLFSGYSFNTGNEADRAAGPPAATVYVGSSPSNCAAAAIPPAGQWVCEHRRRAVANMVLFRNAANSTFSYSHLWNNGNNIIAFARGNGSAGQSKGYVLINREGAPRNGFWYDTGMPAGTYCDVIHGDFTGSSCSGPTISVNAGGWAQLNVAAMDAVAFHVGAKLP